MEYKVDALRKVIRTVVEMVTNVKKSPTKEDIEKYNHVMDLYEKLEEIDEKKEKEEKKKLKVISNARRKRMAEYDICLDSDSDLEDSLYMDEYDEFMKDDTVNFVLKKTQMEHNRLLNNKPYVFKNDCENNEDEKTSKIVSSDRDELLQNSDDALESGKISDYEDGSIFKQNPYNFDNNGYYRDNNGYQKYDDFDDGLIFSRQSR